METGPVRRFQDKSIHNDVRSGSLGDMLVRWLKDPGARRRRPHARPWKAGTKSHYGCRVVAVKDLCPRPTSCHNQFPQEMGP